MSAISRDDFKAFVSKVLGLASNQYKTAVSEDIKLLAKRIYSGDQAILSMDWNTADPYLWSPALAKQAAVMKMNPNMAASTSEQKSFTPISLGGGGVKGKASISQQQQFNLLSPSQFPPLGATATTNHSSVKQPPPPPPPESPTPSSSTLNTNTTLTKQQKKRKSTQMFASVGLNESEEERRQKEKRARRFEREIGIEKLREQGAIQDEEDEVHAPVGDYGGSGLAARLGMRTGRSGRGSRAGYSMGGLEQEEPEADPNVINWDRYTIKGTSTQIEKSYLRLTSAPNPSNIRPLNILEKTLAHLISIWSANSKEYPWICDQFKSMRQDLTVQRIKNDFTVKVYESHAKIALTAGDLGEYNQCQSVLKQLYEHGLPGNPAEFLSYRILYMIHTKNMTELGRAVARLSSIQKREPSIAHALSVHTAITTGNYHKLFKLYISAPKLSSYLMDHFVERERVAALGKISKAYLTVPLEFVTRELGFVDEQDQPQILDLCDLLKKTNATEYSTPNARNMINKADFDAERNRRVDNQLLGEIIWNCRANAVACEAAAQGYKTVDIKGQK